MPRFGASFPSPFPSCQTGIDAFVNSSTCIPCRFLLFLAHIAPPPVFVLSFDRQVSPRKLGVMTSRSERFTTSLTYAHGECRNISPIRAPYENDLGPGTYEGAEKHGSSMTIRRPGVLQCNFASGTPRLPRDRPPMNVGSNTSSVMIDQHSWAEPKVWMGKAESGRHVQGPQIGSQEDRTGMGRQTGFILPPSRVMRFNN